MVNSMKKFLYFYFNPSGRVGRSGFLKKITYIFIIQLTLALLLVAYEKIALILEHPVLFRYVGVAIFLSFCLHILFAIFGLINNIVNRFHDLGKSGLCIIFLMVPIIDIYYLCLLFLKEGNQQSSLSR